MRFGAGSSVPAAGEYSRRARGLRAAAFRGLRCLGLGAVTLALSLPAAAEESDANKLAAQLSNPVAALISVPFQLNYDDGYGAQSNGSRWTLNTQPVIPISISEEWNVISRTIVPLITQNFPSGPTGTQTGLGDIIQSLFFSPKNPTASGWIWGAGPALLLPTGADGFSAHQWGAGPTAVVLKQENGWTYGMLANQIWSFSSNQANAADVSGMFLQPFLAKIIGPGRTVSVNTESSYDWKNSQWTVPINASVSQVLKMGTQLVSISIGVRGYAVSPANGPDWGARVVFTLLYPK